MAFEFIAEALLAFLLIFISTYVIYALGKRSAPKTTISENEQAAYACGEKVIFRGVKINVSLYKYLIYFVIFDSSVLVLAFASFVNRWNHKSPSLNSLPRHNSCRRYSSRRRRKRIMTDTKTWARVKSPWVLHFNSGACNGCDIEIVALLTPKYDVERFGVKLEPSPRHADVLLVTGCVTQQCAERLKRVYDQMPQPKFVVAIGACACSGGVFEGNYNVLGGVDKVIPVTAYIPGCPPRPEAILDGVVKLLNALNPPKPKEAT